jgi:hypothetical protein
VTYQASAINPLATNPSLPIYLLRDQHGSVEGLSQDPALAGTARWDDVVAAEWLAPDDCGKNRPHPPHTWGGEGWSEFRCGGHGRVCVLCEHEPVEVGRDVCADCEAGQ